MHLEPKNLKVQVRHFESDIGPSQQRNVGVTLSSQSCRYILFLDNDTMIDPRCIGRLIEALDADTTIGVAQPTLMLLGREGIVDSKGGAIDVLGNPRSLHKHDRNGKGPIHEIAYAESAVLLFRRSLMSILPSSQKPFDASYFIHWEDIDLSWTVWSLGSRVVNVEDAVAFNERRISGKLSSLASRSIYLNTRNRLVTIMKHASWKRIATYFPVTVLFELSKIVVLCFVSYDHAISSLKAVIWNLVKLPQTYRERLIMSGKKGVHEDKFTSLMEMPSPLRLMRSYRVHYG